MKSLSLYSRSFASLLGSPRGRRLLLAQWTGTPKESDKRTFRQASNLALDWLLRSQKTGNGGMTSWSVSTAWTSAYPETTGYIIPSLLRAADQLERPEAISAAMKAGRWLLEQQKPEGGWVGGYLDQNKDTVVFNTAQVLRGLGALIDRTESTAEEREKYINALVKASDWLVSLQEPNGSWIRHAHLGQARVYDTYVAAVLAKQSSRYQRPDWAEAARKQCLWALGHQAQNGWWQNADNSIKHNARPILHTLAYTVDGLIDCALELGEPNWLEAARKSADALKEIYGERQVLQGRYDEHWRGSGAFLCTGAAQLALIWMKLDRLSGRAEYREVINSLGAKLKRIQHGSYAHLPETRGGLFGSDPIWGRYEPFSIPNWGVKYALDLFLALDAQTAENDRP